MLDNLELHDIFSEIAVGSHGGYKIEIKAGTTTKINFDCDSINEAGYKAAHLIHEAVMTEVIRNDPEAIKFAAATKAAIIALFPGTPLVEEIPNGYCSNYCCKHLPWFIVTTPVGRIKIGWRKRVLQIDWSETAPHTKDAIQLFESEDVTKSGHMIHAWSYQDAGRYIKTIIDSTKRE